MLTISVWVVASAVAALFCHPVSAAEISRPRPVDDLVLSVSQSAKEGDQVRASAQVRWPATIKNLTPAKGLGSAQRKVGARIISTDWVQPRTSSQQLQAPEIELTRLSGILGLPPRYVGTFNDLPAAKYTVEITATQKTLLPPSELPGDLYTTIQKTEKRDFTVGLPEKCFNFPAGDTEGWTLGVFSYPANTVPTGGNLDLLADGENFGGEVSAALRVDTHPDRWPALNQFAQGFWRLAFDSPSLEGRPEWQGIKGVSLRLKIFFSVADPVTVIPVLRIRKPDNTEVWSTLVDDSGEQFTWPAPQSSSYRTLVADIRPAEGSTILFARINIIGEVANTIAMVGSLPEALEPPAISVDAVCPRR